MEDERKDGAYGTPQKYDPTFKGPIYNRGCTDIICCVFLLLAIVGYVAVGIIAWTHGDPRKVIYPTDSRGEFCGQKGTKNANKPYLFYFNIVKCASPLVLLEFQCPTPQICVEKCPDRYLTYLNAHRSQDFEYYKQFCVPGFQNNKGVAEVLRDGDCPAVLTPSTLLARRCFPAIHAHKGVLMVGNETTYEDGHGARKNITELVEGAKKANGVLEARQLAMRIFEDYTVSWYWIVIGLVIAMVMSLLFIVLLRFLAGIMVWVMIVMVILVLGYGIFHCYMEYARLRGEAGSDVSLVDLGFQTDLRVYLHLRQTWMAFMIILSIIEVIIILLLIFLRKRILIAIALIKEASRAVGYVMCSMLYPLVTFFLLCLCIAYWASTAVFLSTSNEAIYKIFDDATDCPVAGKTCNPEVPHRLSGLWCPHPGHCADHPSDAGVLGSAPESCGQQVCQVSHDLSQMLLLVPGEVHQIPQQECLHHGILAFFFFTHRIRIVQDTAPPLNYYWVPILTVIVGSYLIAHGFFSVYGMCVDTLFLCFLEDLERNDGSAERPYFMSSNLKKLLNKTNKKLVES
ncbi:choline transporter-like protein 2 isoform X6 [Pteropus vampyrus]|uniref:Choline transporter-like protein n=1 Tax=Pteropus vampyrus TaxID=132908 RepID=A0A6P6BVL0_PTEVA|nr:choline transporter-like protein 2 isoform X6 [Pteropus vampyrus]